MNKEDKENVGNGKANGQCSKGDKCSFRHNMDKRAKSSTAEPFSRVFNEAECEKYSENQES